MKDAVIDWDGSNVPNELRHLPPGRYAVWPLEDSLELTPDEDTAVREGLGNLAAGDVVPLDIVIKEIESRSNRP